jgi:hypothetical protein
VKRLRWSGVETGEPTLRGDLPVARRGSPARARFVVGLLGLAAIVVASVFVSVPVGAVRSTPGLKAASYSIRAFDDVQTPFYSTSGTHSDVLINRWQPLQLATGAYHWSAPDHAGTPYRSGGGMWEVQTPYGPGFKFVVTDEMTVPSGGKLAMIQDRDHLIPMNDRFLGMTQDWSGMFMFPAAGNPNGFPRSYSDWGAIIEFHTDADDVWNQIGVDTTNVPYRNTIYFRSWDPVRHSQRKVLAPKRLKYDRWYSWRIRYHWSWGTDGATEMWLDGVKLADWRGANLPRGEYPYFDFGFYTAAQYRNEVWHAKLRER